MPRITSISGYTFWMQHNVLVIVFATAGSRKLDLEIKVSLIKHHIHCIFAGQQPTKCIIKASAVTSSPLAIHVFIKASAATGSPRRSM